MRRGRVATGQPSGGVPALGFCVSALSWLIEVDTHSSKLLAHPRVHLRFRGPLRTPRDQPYRPFDSYGARFFQKRQARNPVIASFAAMVSRGIHPSHSICALAG